MTQYGLFAEFPVIETERLRLDRIKLSDAEQLLQVRGSIEGARYGPEAWTDIAFVREKIASYHRAFDKKEDIMWGLFLRDSGRLIGHFNYCYNRRYLGSIGYHTAEDCWRQGYATETLRAALNFLYERTDAHRLQATVHRDHIVSMRLLEKFGFVKEGLLRHRVWWQGRFCDLWMYSLLRGELVL